MKKMTLRRQALRWAAVWACAVTVSTGPQVARAEAPPGVFGVDAPELARPGPFAVGVRTLPLVERNQLDILAVDPKTNGFARHDRTLTVDLWYPAANPAPGTPRETYVGSLPSEPPAEPARFTVPGVAVRNAPPAGGGYPLVIVSHGYSNVTAAMTWLTENLASKGYVVAAIRHDDPPITDVAKFPQVALRRPLDIAFVTRSLQESLAAEHLIDPTRTALVGYSIGGYGVLTCAGATLDPNGPLTKMVPGGLLAPYVRGAPESQAITVKSLKAVVAISPAGGGNLAAWGEAGLENIRVPLLLIAGNKDRTVDYTTGARAFFDGATHSTRYLLTFKEGGHALGLNVAPEAMQARLWDKDWFEDPVWRKERISAINDHFITAFLDRYVKEDTGRQAWLDVPTPDSDAGVWAAQSKLPYGAYSPADAHITVWKGFQRNHAAGLELLRAAATP
jgi:predicted dienelactone hydrolase